ncbi:phage antirepressor N-terminal domain-containing protein [Microbacteriaceae bacterium K1510]|nr:phage antirepressor N-terminal domain-containing protein [Microbacteriaceae bacterium K1510]
MQNVMKVSFHGNELIGVREMGIIHVALKPIVEGIGLDWSSQLKKIKSDPLLSKGMVTITIPSGKGGPQQYACLQLRLLPGWLFKIDVRRADERLRERILVYQDECYDVLYRHFSGQAAVIQSPGYERRSIEMVKQARLLCGRKAGAEIWIARGLPMVPEIQNVFKQLGLFDNQAV